MQFTAIFTALTMATAALATPIASANANNQLVARTGSESCSPDQTFSCCEDFVAILGISIPIGVNCVLGPLVGSCSSKNACCSGDFDPVTSGLIVVGPINLQCNNIL